MEHMEKQKLYPYVALEYEPGSKPRTVSLIYVQGGRGSLNAAPDWRSWVSADHASYVETLLGCFASGCASDPYEMLAEIASANIWPLRMSAIGLCSDEEIPTLIFSLLGENTLRGSTEK